MQEIEVGNVYELTDDESGKASNYQVVGLGKLGDACYAAIVPYGQEVEEYVILRIEEEGEDLVLLAIEDDDEWECAAVYFDNEIFGTVDHDGV